MSLSKRSAEDNNSLLSHHIQSILQSGLLLDEDMDYVLSQYNFDDEKTDEKGLSTFEKLLGVMSLATTMLIVQRKYSFVLTTFTASPFLLMGLRKLRNMIRRRNHKRNLELVIETSQKISKLNRMIFEYFKARSIIDPNTVSIINPYTKGMKQLMKTIFHEEVDLLYNLRIIIRQFGAFVPSLNADYAYLENLEFEDFQSLNVKTVTDCVTYLKKLCDICVLLISNCLSCLALALSPRLLAKHEVDVDEILNKVVPKMKTTCTKCYNRINKTFDDCKYYYLNKSQKKKPFKKPKPNAASKLKIGTYNTMIHTTEILEKSKIIFNKIQEVDLQSRSDKEKLGKCLYELRGHVFDYYESLDVLCKLYDVHINAAQDKLNLNGIQVVNVEKSVNDGIMEDASFNPVEPSDDEEFELYIGANDTSTESASFSYQEEQESHKFASLLSQELKHKLKTHTQFIAARKKRGIIDEEPEPVQPPEEIDNPIDEEESPPVIFMNPRVPPPPPPPLPPLDLGPYGGNVGSLYTVDDYLESIEAAIRSRNSVEEVFGNDSDN